MDRTPRCLDRATDEESPDLLGKSTPRRRPTLTRILAFRPPRVCFNRVVASSSHEPHHKADREPSFKTTPPPSRRTFHTVSFFRPSPLAVHYAPRCSHCDPRLIHSHSLHKHHTTHQRSLRLHFLYRVELALLDRRLLLARNVAGSTDGLRLGGRESMSSRDMFRAAWRLARALLPFPVPLLPRPRAAVLLPLVVPAAARPRPRPPRVVRAVRAALAAGAAANGSSSALDDDEAEDESRSSWLVSVLRALPLPFFAGFFLRFGGAEGAVPSNASIAASSSARLASCV